LSLQHLQISGPGGGGSGLRQKFGDIVRLPAKYNLAFGGGKKTFFLAFYTLTGDEISICLGDLEDQCGSRGFKYLTLSPGTGDRTQALALAGQCCTTELHPQPSTVILVVWGLELRPYACKAGALLL
jgi:hypothetical protein